MLTMAQRMPSRFSVQQDPSCAGPKTHWYNVIFMVKAADKQSNFHFQVSKQLLKVNNNVLKRQNFKNIFLNRKKCRKRLMQLTSPRN